MVVSTSLTLFMSERGSYIEQNARNMYRFDGRERIDVIGRLQRNGTAIWI